jgi:restriction endonuclease Mrr
LIGF